MSILIDYLETNRLGRCRHFNYGSFPLDLAIGFHLAHACGRVGRIKEGKPCGCHRYGCCDHRFCFGDRVGNRATTCCSVSGAICRTNGIRD